MPPFHGSLGMWHLLLRAALNAHTSAISVSVTHQQHYAHFMLQSLLAVLAELRARRCAASRGRLMHVWLITHSWTRLFCTVYCILRALQYKWPHLSLCLPLFLPFLFAALRAETLRCKPEALGALMADHTQLDWRPVLPLLELPCLNVVGGCRYAMLTECHLCYAQAQMA